MKCDKVRNRKGEEFGEENVILEIKLKKQRLGNTFFSPLKMKSRVETSSEFPKVVDQGGSSRAGAGAQLS